MKLLLVKKVQAAEKAKGRKGKAWGKADLHLEKELREGEDQQTPPAAPWAAMMLPRANITTELPRF